MGQLMVQEQTTAISAVTMEMLRAQAEKILASGIVPKAIDTVEKLMVVGMKGMEIGLPMVKAMTEIDVIYNKPRPASKLQLELAIQRIPGFSYDILETSDHTCTLEFRRPGRSPFKFTYTRADADLAKFSLEQSKVWDEKAKRSVGTGQWKVKDNWEKQPRMMLFYRCATQGLAMFAPDFSSMMNYHIDLTDNAAINRQIGHLTGKSSAAEAVDAKSVDVPAESVAVPVDEYFPPEDGQSEEIPAEELAPPPPPAPKAAPVEKPIAKSPSLHKCAECGVDLTVKVSDYSYQKFAKRLCYDHQPGRKKDA